MALFAEFISSALGDGQPKVPARTAIDPQAVQRQTVAGNTAIIPETLSQTKTLNTFNFDEINRMLDQASGGAYQSALKKYFANMERQLSGNVDLRENLAGTAAANLYRGVGGSQFGALTGIKNAQSYIDQQKQIGSTSLERWGATAAQIYQPISVERMFARNSVGTEFGIQNAREESNAQFQHDYVQAQWDWYGSFGQQLVRFENTAIQLASSIAGGMMG